VQSDVTPAVTKVRWFMGRRLWTHPSLSIFANAYISGHPELFTGQSFIQPHKVLDSSSCHENCAPLVGIMPAGAPQLRGLIVNTDLIGRRVKYLGNRILNVNPYFLWIVLVVFVLAKTGFRSSSLGVSTNFIPALAEMPNATSLFQSGFGPFWLAFALGIDTTREWIMMTTLILASAIALVVPLAKRRFPGNVQFALILIAALPILSTQFSWIGMYDPFIFLGLIIWGLGRSTIWWVVGAFIASSANPEQLTVAATLALLVTFTMKLSSEKRRALILLGVSIFNVAVSQLWFLLSGNSSNRSNQLGELLEPSLYSFSMYWPLYVWGIFGVLWIVVLLSVASLQSKKSAIISLVILVGIPLLAGAITLDGFRVLALVALPVTLLIVGNFVDSIKTNKFTAPFIAVAMLFILVIAPPAELSWPAIGPIIIDFLNQYF